LQCLFVACKVVRVRLSNWKW